MVVLVRQRHELGMECTRCHQPAFEVAVEADPVGVLEEDEARVGAELLTHEHLALLVGPVVRDEADEVRQCLVAQ